MIIRQGDVILRRVADAPTTKTKPMSGVLALGETSGHAHVLERCQSVELDASALADAEQSVIGRVTISEPTMLVHVHDPSLRLGPASPIETNRPSADHAAIPVVPGTYEIRRAREYAPESLRRVAD